MQTPTPTTAHQASLASELLAELQKADQLLRLMLQQLTPRQQLAFAQASEAAGLGIDGATRFHERAAVVAKARAMGLRP